MNSALLYLLRKQTIGTLRQIRRRFAGIKGALMAIGIVVVLCFMLVPLLFSSGGSRERAELTAEIRTWGSLGLLVFLVATGMTARTLYFKPAEVDFLFPAPISRRQLVLYNTLGRLRVVFLSALWCSLFLVSRAQHWFAGFCGILLSLALMQLTVQCLGLFFSAVSEALGKKLRRLLLLGIAALVVGGLMLAREQVAAGGSFLEVASAFVDSPAVRALSWVTRPFIEVFVAESVGSYLMWTSIALAILGFEMLLMMLFDVAYTERAVAASHKIQLRLRRMRSGGSPLALPSRGKAGFVLPRFPRLGGAGPLAWRQLTEMSRNLRSILMMALFMLMPIVPFFLMSAVKEQPLETPAENGASALLPGTSVVIPLIMVLLLSFFFSQNVLFDFRRDLDRMAYLKSLPLSGRAVAAGQLLPTALLLTCGQMLALGALALFVGDLPAPFVLGVLLILPPLNWMVAVIDNSLFLLFPYRMAPHGAGNVPFMGRVMMIMFLKMFVLGILALLGFLVGFLVWSLTESPVVSGLAVASVVAVACMPGTWVVALIFKSFDVTRDVPE